MPNPRDVFNEPNCYWEFITSSSDNDFECQHFDRKEAGIPGADGRVDKKDLKNVKERILECISGFANANSEGGLIAVGVSKTGKVSGIDHLSEEQINSITCFNDLLRNQAVIANIIEYKNSTANDNKVLLIYVHHTSNGFCETLNSPSKAWYRSGKQNIPINDQLRQQLERDKRIVDFERTYCCRFHIDDVDKHVLQEFRKVYLSDATYDYSDEQLLYQAGAIERDGDGYSFNNAGLLFFAINPQRHLSWAYIRLLRFEVNSSEEESRGLPTFDNDFRGAIPQQIRKIRSFFRESGFFKAYQKRNQNGGFIDEPEFPFIAVDEAIVNAVAHRDYGIQYSIDCIHYKDAFVVNNSGRILQREQDIPSQFSLDTTILDSLARNSKLFEWLRMMRDEQGGAFVKKLGEGTKRMQEEMAKAGLPSPAYKTSPYRTVVKLYNNAEEREALLRATFASVTSTEYVNFFQLNFFRENGQKVEPEALQKRSKDFMVFFKDALAARGWYIDRLKYGKLTAHRQAGHLPLPEEVNKFIRLYPAYRMQLREYWRKFYLCIDYTLEVKSVLKLNDLLRWIAPSDLEGRTVVAKMNGWQTGKLLMADAELALIYFFDLNIEQQVTSTKVIPELPINLIQKILNNAQINFELTQEIKRHSFVLTSGAARVRFEKTITTAQEIANSIFPLAVGELRAILQAKPTLLQHHNSVGELQVHSLSEPTVEFSREKETSNIREGITSFGAYDSATRKTIELVPVCTTEMRDNMVSLIKRLKVGKYKYKGLERTFSASIVYSSVILVPSPENILEECQRLLNEHPDWIGNKELNRIFLVHTPDKFYSLDDETSPYYQIKKFLLEQGIPCQMVNTPTLLNPDWRDLNLALNIVAKCGITPWVLPNKIPDADFFIGFSYTKSRVAGSERLVGYATVFNAFGRWQFYSGNTKVFPYEERTKYFALLTKQTLERLRPQLSETPSIYFHYSARFSREDREAVLEAARSVQPSGTYSFVSINSHHDIRLYDNRAETDGSLKRGSYVVTNVNQIVLSTTGYNPFRKSLGTPKPLEITIWTHKPENATDSKPDLKSLAVQILSLTKLNWASTDSISGEPITTKYAGSIAYLTDAFLRQSKSFHLHPVLETTPWFI